MVGRRNNPTFKDLHCVSIAPEKGTDSSSLSLTSERLHVYCAQTVYGTPGQQMRSKFPTAFRWTTGSTAINQSHSENADTFCLLSSTLPSSIPNELSVTFCV